MMQKRSRKTWMVNLVLLLVLVLMVASGCGGAYEFVCCETVEINEGWAANHCSTHSGDTLSCPDGYWLQTVTKSPDDES